MITSAITAAVLVGCGLWRIFHGQPFEGIVLCALGNLTADVVELLWRARRRDREL